MNNAMCTKDGLTYTALEFSYLLPTDLELKRRFLQCPACGGLAFFRHASSIGRAACFGARPHANGCELAAQDCASDDQDTTYIPVGKIIVDFQYGAPVQQDYFKVVGRPSMQDQIGCNYDQPHTHIYRRRLGPLLRTLIEHPEFSSSDMIVEIEGRGECAARDFFLPLTAVSYLYSGSFKQQPPPRIAT
jgi:hypothetical protein